MSQTNSRRYAHFIDQHGRRWGAVIEIRTGHAVGAFEPDDFRAPVLPPNRHIHHVANDPVAIRIDYEGWVAESRRARLEYERRVREVATRLSAQGQVERMLAERPPELLDIVGSEPDVVDPLVIQAAKAGNPWVIRFEGDMPSAARAYFPGLVRVLGETGPGSRLREPAIPEEDPFAPGRGARQEREASAPVPLANGNPFATDKPHKLFEDALGGDDEEGEIPPDQYVFNRLGNGYARMPDGENRRDTMDNLVRYLALNFPEHYAAVRESIPKEYRLRGAAT
jgi:hypothetical protein